MAFKVLVTGASGMLGYAIAGAFHQDKEFNVLGVGRKNIASGFPYQQVDLINEKQVSALLESYSPDIIVHCAANVDLQHCERDKSYADAIHVESTRLLASYRPGITRLIYISTDAVFDGQRGNYSEQEKTAPLNYYAYTKLKGEEAAVEYNSSTIILRTNIYGFHKPQKGSSLFEWLYKTLNDKTSLNGFTDVHFNPLYLNQVFEVIKECLALDFKGVLHAGCRKFISKYEFAIQVAELFDFDKSLIQPAEMASINAEIKRPANTTLNVSKMEFITGKLFYLSDGLSALKKDLLNG